MNEREKVLKRRPLPWRVQIPRYSWQGEPSIVDADGYPVVQGWSNFGYGGVPQEQPDLAFIVASVNESQECLTALEAEAARLREMLGVATGENRRLRTEKHEARREAARLREALEQSRQSRHVGRLAELDGRMRTMSIEEQLLRRCEKERDEWMRKAKAAERERDALRAHLDRILDTHYHDAGSDTYEAIIAARNDLYPGFIKHNED